MRRFCGKETIIGWGNDGGEELDDGGEETRGAAGRGSRGPDPPASFKFTVSNDPNLMGFFWGGGGYGYGYKFSPNNIFRLMTYSDNLC